MSLRLSFKDQLVREVKAAAREVPGLYFAPIIGAYREVKKQLRTGQAQGVKLRGKQAAQRKGKDPVSI